MKNSLIPLLAAFAVGAGCSPYEADGAACPASTCSDHGTCSYKDTFPTCACATGYAGLVCGNCAEGFHRASDDSCVADEACTPGLCGDHGTCALSAGRTVCACESGYAGLACDTCRAGHHDDAGTCVLDATCFPSTCSGGGTCSVTDGRVSCACDEGRAGSFCETRNAACTEGLCGSHGECRDGDGVVRCLCDPGYGGPTCATCAPGFRADEAGCVLAEECTASTCSFAGVCAAEGGLTTCDCDPGYAGDHCEVCDEGFHRGAGYRCVADESCTDNVKCGSHGTCFEDRGAALCRCAFGWAGATCTTCAPGYHADGDTCVLDAACLPYTCRFHGTCELVGGVPACACDTGYSGDHCELNADDCVNNACGPGACIDLLDANVCLCPNGAWSASCEAP